MSIPQNLKELRKLAGMTQEEVAAQVGLTRQAVSSYESGRTEPDLQTLGRLAEVYNTDLSGILYGSSRGQRRQRALRRAAVALTAAVLGLLLLRSWLLLALNHFFPIPEGAAETGVLETLFSYRFAALRAAELLGGLAQLAAWGGAVALAVLLWDCPRRPGVLHSIGRFLAFTAGALAATLPFSLLDPLYKAADYCLPLLNALLPVLLLLLFSIFCSARRSDKA